MAGGRARKVVNGAGSAEERGGARKRSAPAQPVLLQRAARRALPVRRRSSGGESGGAAPGLTRDGAMQRAEPGPPLLGRATENGTGRPAGPVPSRRSVPLRHDGAHGTRGVSLARPRRNARAPSSGAHPPRGRGVSRPSRPLVLSLGGKKKKMVRPTGLEPVTSGSVGRCSIQLSHGRTGPSSIPESPAPRKNGQPRAVATPAAGAPGFTLGRCRCLRNASTISYDITETL